MDYSNKVYYTERHWLTGFNVIKEATLAEFLREFCSDETTTPGGVAPRLHVRQSGVKWQVWTWGVAGNNPRLLDEYDTEKEANDDIMEFWRQRFLHGVDNPPAIWDSLGDLLRDAAEDGVLVLSSEEHNKILGEKTKHQQS